MIEGWRWFGENDPISLSEIKEMGATEVITALHHKACGELWAFDDIIAIKNKIETAGLSWKIVESLPIHETIKKNSPKAQHYIDIYIQSMENLAKAGIGVICYNFMPMTDWTRTSLFEPQADGSEALCFDYQKYIMYDLFLLEREGAQNDYSSEQKAKAKALFETMDEHAKQTLIKTIGLGLPGTVDDLSLDDIRANIKEYENISNDDLRQNLYLFLQKILPTAQKFNIKMAIHPDDPPISLFGLPRILSSYADIDALFKAVPSEYSGLTLCAGSLGAGKHNDVTKITQDFSHRIYFAHLRSVKHKGDYFVEAPHLKGDQDIGQIIQILLNEENKRLQQTGEHQPITFRPDHGNLMLTDKNLARNHYYPGYSLLGRFKALAELRGVIYSINSVTNI